MGWERTIHSSPIGSRQGVRPMSTPTPTAIMMPITSERSDAQRSRRSPAANPSAMPKIGPIRGATSIAPTTTAALFINSPYAAITVASATIM